MKHPDPPKELLEQRPSIVVLEEIVSHPETGAVLGRPPNKYTKAVHDRICEELAKGQRAQGACARAGITTATYYEWVRRGKAGDPWLHDFAQDVEIAINKAEAAAVDVVTEGFLTQDPDKKDPELAKWFLEHTRGDGYSKQVKSVVENTFNEFLLRCEKAFDAATYERILAVALGQAPSVLPAAKEITVLPEHVIEQVDSQE